MYFISSLEPELKKLLCRALDQLRSPNKNQKTKEQTKNLAASVKKTITTTIGKWAWTKGNFKMVTG